jgi:GNAT superfamily N-acetyltransferase
MPIIQIQFLKDTPHFIDEVGALWHEEWGDTSNSSDLLRKRASVVAKANVGSVPFILVATIGGVLAGSASAFISDLEPRPDLTPWLAAVVTKQLFRGLGVAEQLTAAVINECRLLGYERIYLRTEKADTLFTRLGWSLVESTDDEKGVATRIFDMKLSSKK